MVHRQLGVAVNRWMRARRAHDDERGIVLVMTVITLTVLMAMAALVIDLGNARQQRRQAQVGADAAALAGADLIETLGAGFTGTPAQWASVVAQVKGYALQNHGITAAAWNGCSDSSALTYRPDSASSNSCISADFSAWPTPGASETSLTNRLRVRMPTLHVKTLFANSVDELDVSATATAAITRTRTVITTSTTTQEAGGPCALCLLGPGLSLNGQNGDITVTGGNVVVNSTSGTASSLGPNGHVTVIGGSFIGGPNAPANFSGNGYSPLPTQHDPVADPLAAVPACGTGSTCPTNNASDGSKGSTLSPGIYTTISNSHTLNPGIYVIKNGITLNGNDIITGTGVMLYFACSNYPTPCTTGQTGAGITATGNGALRLTAPTAAQCTTQTSVCPYQGITIFSDRNNASTLTFRGNGSSESGGTSGSSGTFYLKSGTLDLRGNGYTLSSQIIAAKLDMNGNPSGVTIAYNQSLNAPETHSVTTTTTSTAYSYDAGGLIE